MYKQKQYEKYMWHRIILIIHPLKKIDYSHMSCTTSFTLILNHEKDHWKENIFTVLIDNNEVKNEKHNTNIHHWYKNTWHIVFINE